MSQHCCSLAWLRVHQWIEMLLQGQNWIKKLGGGEQKTSFMTSWSGTRHKWLSVFKKSFFLPNCCLMLRWWCGGLQGDCTYGALTSPISSSLPLHFLALRADRLNFPSSNYSCNLITWCQLKHRLSCQTVMAPSWRNMFSHQSNLKAARTEDSCAHKTNAADDPEYPPVGIWSHSPVFFWQQKKA